MIFQVTLESGDLLAVLQGSLAPLQVDPSFCPSVHFVCPFVLIGEQLNV